MKINYQQTVDKAKEMNLITDTDKYVFCTVRPKDGRNMGMMQEVIYYKYDILFVMLSNAASNVVKLIYCSFITNELFSLSYIEKIV